MGKNKKNIDRENLRQVILDSPQQFGVGLELASDIKIKGNFKSVEVSGMGGSSWPVNVLRIYLNALYLNNPKTKGFGLFQNRFYNLPHEAYDNALNIFTSYSGNTEETISSLKEAILRKLPSVGITTGGKLLDLCKKNNIPCVILPTGVQPRYATNYFFSAMLKILNNSGLIHEKHLDTLMSLAKNLEKDVIELEAEGKKLAKKLVGKTPIIYSSAKFKSLAMIWKIKINENSKTPAFWNFYPELSHNEMVGFTLPQSKFHIISLLDEKDHAQNKKRFSITANILKKKGIGTTIIKMPNDNIFHTIFSTMVLGDWVSYYLALEYGQDPTPVDIVEDLKKELE
ncbi:MAG: bifunctional phosphoglucose/phosphomannose isomerase [Parcubacteria group bacterium]|jgi:glucose/mannose-6-phosphate isomerase